MAGVPPATVPALLRLGALPQRDWGDALEEVLQIDVGLLDVERVSFWSFQRDPPSIACELGYVRGKRLFERGAMFLESECREYLSEVRRARVVAVRDATTDSRLACLAEYVRSHDIGALLDVPVFAGGELAGILCHEHIGGPREWTTHEIEIALSMSHTVAALLEARARSNAEEAERRAAFLAHAGAALATALEVQEAQRKAVRLAVPTLGEIATLIAFDGARAWRAAQAHATPEGQTLLEQLTKQYGGDIQAPGLGVQAIRERQSLILPVVEPDALGKEGLHEPEIALLKELHVRSAMAVLTRARGVITGVLTFAATARNYGRDELRFAEAYASQVGILLSNVQLYSRAQEAVRARDEFLSLAAHEIRTPLAALTFSAEVLARETPTDAPNGVRGAVAILGRQTKRLSRLSDLLIAATEADAAPMALSMETIDVAALVREVAADFEELLARAGCELRLVAEKPVVIHGDRVELKVVVASLLDNAMKFGAGRPIDVTVDAPSGHARVTVRDHGMGISNEQHARLFQRFERGVSPRHFGGLGLGLHISSRIVAAHGGSIRAESRAGEGAALIVELPCDATREQG